MANTPTPLQPLDRLSERIGGPRIWVKRDDLTGLECSGNKVRKLEYVLAHALGLDADTVITCGGIQSNHCRATALLAAKLGLKCHLVLRGRAPATLDGNTLMARLAGAELSFYPPSEYRANLHELMEKCAKGYEDRGNRPYLIPTGASNAVGLWGYIAAAYELTEDMDREQLKPVAVCCATGSGGTHTGLALGMQRLKPDVPVRGYAVCDSKAYFEAKAREDVAQWQANYARAWACEGLTIDVEDRYMGQGYGLAGPEVFATMELVAQTEGLVLDPVYTAKAFTGMIDQIQSGWFGNEGDIVFVHTGGLFGVFPYRNQMSKRLQ